MNNAQQTNGQMTRTTFTTASGKTRTQYTSPAGYAFIQDGKYEWATKTMSFTMEAETLAEALAKIGIVAKLAVVAPQ